MADALVDTGVFLGFLSPTDRWHAAASKGLAASGGRLLTTWFVVTETVHMIGRPDASTAFLDYLARGAVAIPPFGAAEIEALVWYFRKYRDLDPDLADLSLLVLADLTGIRTILTFDRDYLVYRTRKKRSLLCPLLK